MSGAEIIKLLLTASVLLLVFALGLRARFTDVSSLFRESFRPPHRLLRSLAAMYLVVPSCALGLGLAFDLPVAVRVAILAMAISPIPPILPGKQLKFGGHREYVFGLIIAVSLCAFVLVPIMVELIGRMFGREATFGPWSVARVIAPSILIPLALGMTVRHFAPHWASRIAPWASRVGNIVLVAGVLPVLVKAWPAMVSLIGHATMVSILILVVVAIAIGHSVGGPDPHDRSTLAFASAMRHPGVAMAIATQNMPDEPRVGAAVLLYLLVAVVATSVYGMIWKHAEADGA
jgi:BASS family bile acid:Na+ symporter